MSHLSMLGPIYGRGGLKIGPPNLPAWKAREAPTQSSGGHVVTSLSMLSVCGTYVVGVFVGVAGRSACPSPSSRLVRRVGNNEGESRAQAWRKHGGTEDVFAGGRATATTSEARGRKAAGHKEGESGVKEEAASAGGLSMILGRCCESVEPGYLR